MDHRALPKKVLDERPSLRLHLRELLRRVDQEIKAWPDLVDAFEVPISFEERPRRVCDDDEVEIAPLVSVTTRDGAEDDGLPEPARDAAPGAA